MAVEKTKRTKSPERKKNMTTVNFAANSFAYYLHSEHYEALSKKEQGLVKMRSCKIRKRRKTV